MKDTEILKSIWNWKQANSNKFKNVYGAKRFRIMKTINLKGRNLGKLWVTIAEQNPAGKSPEAELVRSKKMKAEDIIWVYTRLYKDIIWLGKVVKGQPEPIQYFDSDSNGVWNIY